MYITNVLSWLENAAAKFPDKIAFADEKGSISYKELVRRAAVLGVETAAVVGKIRKPVAVLCDRSLDCIVGFLGTLYAGCFYVPIDSEMPVSRASALAKNLSPSLVLCPDGEKYSDFAEKVFPGVPALSLSDSGKNATESALSLLDGIRRRVIDTDPMYIIHTSGSTGVPKGIVVSHRSVIDFIEWMTDEIGFSSDDIFANQAPFFFDASVKDIYLTLRHGATDFIIPKKLFMFPPLLIDFLEKNRVSAVTWATSAFNLIANSGILEKKKPSHLRTVVLGGEALRGKQLNAWRRNLPNVKYVNLYGPTEVTVDCTCFIVDRDFADGESVPIGKACRNMEVMLWVEEEDGGLRDAHGGESGEICVRGTGLAKGYYNDPEKTAAAFVQNPHVNGYSDIIYRTGDIGIYDKNGDIVFLARKDGQIKHMGYRIELGEIENALIGIDFVRNAACFFDADADRIVAAVETDRDSVSKEEMTKLMLLSVPKYMLPNIYRFKNRMPYTANGKIDRVKLREEYFSEKQKAD